MSICTRNWCFDDDTFLYSLLEHVLPQHNINCVRVAHDSFSSSELSVLLLNVAAIWALSMHWFIHYRFSSDRSWWYNSVSFTDPSIVRNRFHRQNQADYAVCCHLYWTLYVDSTNNHVSTCAVQCWALAFVQLQILADEWGLHTCCTVILLFFGGINDIRMTSSNALEKQCALDMTMKRAKASNVY